MNKKRIIGDYEYTLCKSGDLEIIETGEGYGYILIERDDQQDAALALLGGLTDELIEKAAMGVHAAQYSESWADAKERVRADCRAHAKAALEAVFGVFIVDERIYQNSPYDLRSPLTKVILLARTGSVSQNTDLDDGNDEDVEGIIFPPVPDILGSKPWTHWSESSKKLDVKFYSPKRFVELLSNLGPSQMNVLWLRSADVYEWSVPYTYLRELRDDLTCVQALVKLHGYAFNQLKAMHSSIAGKVQPSRQPLVDLYGFDTKFACHAIRVMEMAIGFALSGELVVYRPNGWQLRDIRRGRVEPEVIVEWFEHLEASFEAAMRQARANMPDRPKLDRLEEWLVSNAGLWVNEYQLKILMARADALCEKEAA